MTTETKLEASLWEKFTDSMSSFTEGIVGFIGRMFGSSNERVIRDLGYIRYRATDEHTVVAGSLLDQVNVLEPLMQELRDDEFEALTAEFRRRLGVEHRPLPKKTISGQPPAENVEANGQPEGHTEEFDGLLNLLEERLPSEPTLDDLLPYAFAACREAARRTKNMRDFDTQIVGGAILHQGNIAEMVTGEGKTLVATLPAYLNALTGKGVHIVTVNDYLARRDCEWMSPIYHLLGIPCGFIQSDMDPIARRQAYDCDITYGTNSEFGFDYLRDNMKPARWADPDYDPYYQQVQKALNFAIIDEVDNILIDEARTPLIISGPAFGDLRRYAKANEIAVRLTELEKKAQAKLRQMDPSFARPHVQSAEDDEMEEQSAEDEAKDEKEIGDIALPERDEKEKRLGYYFEVKEKERTCHLTDEGVRKAEELAGVESFYTAGNMEWPHLIDNALKAQHLYQKDKQYVVMPHPENKELSVIIVDEFTGRLMIGRQWSDGLHQAVEAKHLREGVKIKEETQTLATITLQNFFKLYKKLAGMTGTAMTEANEFWKIYKLDVVAIPTNKPLIRLNYPDVIYLTEKEKWQAVLEDVERLNKWDVIHKTDGTELVGTIRQEKEDAIDFQDKTNQRLTIAKDDIDDIDRKGRPILIGTTDVNKSEKLSSMLNRRGIKHELLNAKPEFAAREAEIVAQAGRTGAVTISTNMAGRGTDIILGGNAETLAWARLKDKYPTLLDVPADLWKQTVQEIKTKEKMDEEGRKVAAMGGLHIIGTERHEARRIDNQLRGRAGRQGDPGSGRFFLSLQDDLMRIFAGEWVASVLQRLGMTEGQSIESRMVTRRVEAAQKKVEERNFDIRKNLLEYDEVMDHQRKRVYGYRQQVLEGANCKIRILNTLDAQIDTALERFLETDYGPASFAELASQRLGIEFDPGDFHRAEFVDADKTAREKAYKNIPTQIQEWMDENLSADVDANEWNWQNMSNQVNSRWGLKTTERQLKQMGRDNVGEALIEEAQKSVAEVDLSKGAVYLEPDWGHRSLCEWAQRKFQLKLDHQKLVDLRSEQIRDLLRTEVRQVYRQKEIEFPIKVAMARFMSERGQGPISTMSQRYDREGLYRWAVLRFHGPLPENGAYPPNPLAEYHLSEEDFRTLSRAKIQEKLTDASAKSFPAVTQDDLDAKIEETLEGTSAADEDDARELAEWCRQQLKIDINAEELIDADAERARDILWTAFDKRYRPEMRRMERSLLLGQLDQSWKNHLYTMDHLRQGIGLMGYAQLDPKTEYKRQGMKEFDSMWEALEDRITDTVFRMEDDESFQESVWSISAAVHESNQNTLQAMRAQVDQVAGNQQSEKKKEPIRRHGEKVGRNDPCPCGSGKKYKNCCMRQVAR